MLHLVKIDQKSSFEVKLKPCFCSCFQRLHHFFREINGYNGPLWNQEDRMNQEKMHFLTNSHLHRNSSTLLCLLPIQIREPSFPITDSEVWRLHCLTEGYLEEQNLSIKRELCQVFSVAFPSFQILPVAFQVCKKISHGKHQYSLPGYPQVWWHFCQTTFASKDVVSLKD